MGFVQSYERLGNVFASGEAVQTATLGDVFLPNDRMPDLSVPIGLKVERQKDLVVPGSAGWLAVSATARITKIDYALCADVVGPDDFTVWTYMTRPEMNSRQIFEWEDGVWLDGKPVQHQARVYTTLEGRVMQRADQEYVEYAAALEAAGSEDERSAPDDVMAPVLLSSHVATKISGLDDARTKPKEEGEPPEIDPSKVISEHFDVLDAVALRYPHFGHLYTAWRSVGESYCTQTPSQFDAYTAWILER